MNLDGLIYILDTDVDNYAVILGCGSVGSKRVNVQPTYGHMVWILSRNPKMTSLEIYKTYDALKKNNLSIELRETDQNNCAQRSQTTE